MDREVQLLRRQISGLQEDNDRINRMYQIVEKEAFVPNNAAGATALRGAYCINHQENNSHKSNFKHDENKSTVKLGGAPLVASKWKTIDDDNFSAGGSYHSSHHRHELPSHSEKNSLE